MLIEYQSGLEKLAARLMPEAEKRAKKGPLTDCEVLIEKLRLKKDRILAQIAHLIAIEKPTAQMKVQFDAWARAVTNVPSTRHIQLWHKTALAEAVGQSGAISPAVAYDPTSNTFSVNSVRYVQQEGLDSLDYTVSDPAPLCVPIDDPASPDALRCALAYVDDHLNKFKPGEMAHTFLHEAAEGALGATGIRGCFRRWLSDGFADYAADLCLESFIGEKAIKAHNAIISDSKYESLKDQVDLLGWRMGEWEIDMPRMDTRLTCAHYVFACREMHGLAKRHGAAVIPAIFREIARSKAWENGASMASVSRAAGEDFALLLSSYGSKSTDQFRGLAVRNFKAGCYILSDKDYLVTNISDVASVPIIADGKHGVCIEFSYDALSYPVALEAVLEGPRKYTIAYDLPPPANPDPDDPMPSAAMARLIFDFKQIGVKPGDYRLRIALRGKLFREISLKLIEQNGRD